MRRQRRRELRPPIGSTELPSIQRLDTWILRCGPSDSPPFCKGDFFEFASTQGPRSERVYVPHGQPRPSTVYAAAAVLWVTAAADRAGKALASQAEGWSAIYCRPGCEVGAPLRCLA